LKVLECPRGERAEDPVDPPAVEPETTELALQRGDIVAAEVRGDQLQRSVTEPP